MAARPHHQHYQMNSRLAGTLPITISSSHSSAVSRAHLAPAPRELKDTYIIDECFKYLSPTGADELVNVRHLSYDKPRCAHLFTRRIRGLVSVAYT